MRSALSYWPIRTKVGPVPQYGTGRPGFGTGCTAAANLPRGSSVEAGVRRPKEIGDGQGGADRGNARQSCDPQWADTERWSHYSTAILPEQFDAWLWFDETHAVEPLPTTVRAGVEETYPFGL